MSKLNFENYENLRKIADGQFGPVCVYKRIKSDKSYAGKQIDLNLYKKFENEKHILEKHADDDQNLIHYFDVIFSKCNTNALLLMELCDGTVQHYVCNQSFLPARDIDNSEMLAKDYFSDITPLEIAKQAVNGVKYLHEKCNIIHRDIKPSNFLMVKIKGIVTVKVADFGLSRELDPSDSGLFSYSEGSNQMAYQPYEIYQSNYKTRKSYDVFSLGVLIHYILTDGHFAFGEEESRQRDNIINKVNPKLHHLKRNLTLGLTEEQTVTACELVWSMVDHRYKNRPDISEVSCHPLFWDSKRKIEFYKEAKSFLDNKNLSEKQQYYLDHFAKRLLTEKYTDKEFEKFKISFIDLHPRLKKSKYIYRCNNITDLLCIIRNQKEHIQDPQHDKKLAKLLGFDHSKYNVNWDIFLQILTKDFPQLLVHLYEFFRHVNAAWSFYPSTTGVQSTSNQSTRNQTSGTPNINKQNISFNGICDITIFYKDVEVDAFTDIDLNRDVSIIYPRNQKAQSNAIFFSKSSDNVVKSILGACKDGITFKKGDNSIILERKCNAEVYFISCIDSKRVIKLEKGLSEEIFPLKSLNLNNGLVPEVKVVIGTKPKVNVGTAVSVLLHLKFVESCL